MRIIVGFEESQEVTIAFRNAGHEAFSCDIEPCSGGHPEWHIQDDIFNHLNDGWDLGIFHPVCTYLTISAEWAYSDVPMINGKVKTILPGTLIGKERIAAREKALEDVKRLMAVPYPYAIENPVGVISTRIRKYDQKIQPWMFGHNASKGTCLWLKGLPPLEHMEIIPPAGYQLVKYAADMPLCPCCEEEAYCTEHECHFGDCDCIGPTQDDATYKTIEGYLFATLDNPPKHPVWGNQTPGGQNKLGPSKDRAKLRSKTYTGIANAMAIQWEAHLTKREPDKRDSSLSQAVSQLEFLSDLEGLF